MSKIILPIELEAVGLEVRIGKPLLIENHETPLSLYVKDLLAEELNK